MTLLNLTSPRVWIPRVTVPRTLSARLVAACLALTVVAAGGVIGVKRFTGLPGDAAFEYDGTVVTTAQLARRVELLGALYGIAQPKDDKGQAAFRRDTAKAVAVSMILDHAARSRGIVIADKAARDTLASMISTQLGGSGGQAEFTRILGQFGVSERNVLDEIKRQQATARLFQTVTAKVVAGVTAADARNYFEAHPTQFAVPEKRHLRNIVVATRKQALRLQAAARGSRDFAALARQLSLDDSTRAAGGNLGTVTADQLETSYANAAFATRSGDTFGPVQTKFGWNIGLVVSIEHGRQVSFDDVSSQALDAVRAERASAAWQSFVAAEIRKADVEYAGSYRPAHPDAPPSGQPSTPSITSTDQR